MCVLNAKRTVKGTLVNDSMIIASDVRWRTRKTPCTVGNEEDSKGYTAQFIFGVVYRRSIKCPGSILHQTRL